MRGDPKRDTILALLSIGMMTSGYASPQKMGLANPAAIYCIEQGGTLEEAQGPDGGARGICIFPDHRQCEEWALFQRDCPLGGVDVSGLTTPAGTYCALKGGTVSEDETTCHLPSGKICPTQEVYEGACS